MNAIGVLQILLIVAIHFSHHGDGPLSIVTSLFHNLGYGATKYDHTLKSKLVATIFFMIVGTILQVSSYLL